MTDFFGFPKIHRLNRECIITEKIDGSNAQIYFDEEGKMHVGSRTRWLNYENDNHGFYKWAKDHEEELRLLGPGKHFGEWWGQGIQRKYGLKEKRFSLFNSTRWGDEVVRPACCHVVPVLYQGLFDSTIVKERIEWLKTHGSLAAPGFMKPEGVVVYHVQGNLSFKVTCEKDEEPKGKSS